MSKKRKSADAESPDFSSDSDTNNDDETSKRTKLRDLLTPFTKDQIIDFAIDAALENPSVFSRITEAANSDPSHRKIFVHGLGWDATTEQVVSAFKPFGEIEECKVVTDKLTGKAKGYGFVLFKTMKAARKALKEPQKRIGSRMTSSQLASAGPVAPGQGNSNDPAERKVYVGNVGPQIPVERLKAFFAKFGEIEEGPLGLDNVTGKFKGYAIFVYKTVEGSRKALEEPFKVFEGSQLQCKLANKPIKGVGTAAAAAVASNAVGTGVLQAGDVGLAHLGYNVGLVNPGFLAAGSGVLGSGIGLQNPMLISALNQSALGLNGIAPSIGGAGQSLGLGANYNINSVSPSVIGNYSQLALQGLGAYRSGLVGSSSAGATAAVSRPQSSLGSGRTDFPGYLGH